MLRIYLKRWFDRLTANAEVLSLRSSWVERAPLATILPSGIAVMSVHTWLQRPGGVEAQRTQIRARDFLKESRALGIRFNLRST